MLTVVFTDGIKSVVREAINGPDVPVPTGDAAYRAVISIEDMMLDPDLAALVHTSQIHCWMGPSRHIVGYCVVRVNLL